MRVTKQRDTWGIHSYLTFHGVALFKNKGSNALYHLEYTLVGE